MRLHRTVGRNLAAVWALGLLLFLGAQTAQAAERYYLIVFGMQKGLNLPRNSHTCAVFIKDASPGPLETVFVSWLPDDLNVTILQRDPQVGVNVDLHATLQHYADRGCRISMWGPFEMKAELYVKAKTRRDILEGCTVGYNAIDRPYRPMVTDCVHAVSGVDVEPGLLRTRSAHGDIASYIVLQHLSCWLIHPEVTYCEIAQRLCLDQYCIRCRDICKRPHALLPILPPYYDTSNVPEGPAGVEAPVPAAPAPANVKSK
jgi:hypothetical protein